MRLNEPVQINTPLVTMLLVKQNSMNTSTVLNINQSSINLPSICDLLANSLNCSKIQVVFKVTLNTYASNKSNNEEVFQGSIGSVEFDIYRLDANSVSPLDIENISKPIEIKIARKSDLSNNLTTFQHINASKMIFQNNQQLLLNSLNLTTLNSSIHIQIISNHSYLIAFSLSDQLSLLNKSYDYFEIICSSKFRLTFIFNKT